MAIIQNLPIELASLLIDCCDSETLLSLCLTSKAWRFLAQRLLFRKVDLRSLNDCVSCCRTLFKRPDLCEFVREFLIMSESKCLLFPSFWELLAKTLNYMPNLTSLHLAMSGKSNIIFRDCTFPQLRSLSSVLDLSPELNDFLARHSSIRQLCIGGEAHDEHIILPPSALPVLESYLGSRVLARDIIPGRPVTQMTLAWTVNLSNDCIIDNVRILAGSSVPVRHFACTTFGSRANIGIMSAVAAHMPELHTLRISNVASWKLVFDADAFCVFLQKFKELHRLDIPCMISANTDKYDSVQEAEEMVVVKMWKAACPSLEIVTLPSCKLWRYQHGQAIWKRVMGKTDMTGFENF